MFSAFAYKKLGLVKNKRHFFLSLFFFMKIKFFKLKEQKLFLADINCTCAVNKADFHLKAQHVSDSLFLILWSVYPQQSVKQFRQCLVDVSQRRTVRSSPQETMSLPSGENLKKM